MGFDYCWSNYLVNWIFWFFSKNFLKISPNFQFNFKKDVLALYAKILVSWLFTRPFLVYYYSQKP